MQPTANPAPKVSPTLLMHRDWQSPRVPSRGASFPHRAGSIPGSAEVSSSLHQAAAFHWAVLRPGQSGTHRLVLGGKRSEEDRFSEEEPKDSLGHLAPARCRSAGGAADRIALRCPGRRSLAINPLPGRGADNSGAEVQRRRVLGSTFQPGAQVGPLPAPLYRRGGRDGCRQAGGAGPPGAAG